MCRVYSSCATIRGFDDSDAASASRAQGLLLIPDARCSWGRGVVRVGVAGASVLGHIAGTDRVVCGRSRDLRLDGFRGGHAGAPFRGEGGGGWGGGGVGGLPPPRRWVVVF